MSADNTIVILHCKDGFRVGHLQAAENLGYYQDIGGSELDPIPDTCFRSE